MPTYGVFGLVVDSERDLAGLRPHDPAHPTSDTVEIRWTWQQQFDSSESALLQRTEHLETLACAALPVVLLRYANDLSFAVETSGRRIWVSPPSGMETAEVSRFLLGPVLGLVLRYRGVTCLHATAVRLGPKRGCLALMGAPGAGKSTLAAALLERGGELLGDDLLALVTRGRAVFVQRGRPKLRLWRESAEAIYGEADAMDPVSSEMPKLVVDASTESGDDPLAPPVALQVVYDLDPSDTWSGAPRVEAVRGSAALMALVANTYPHPENHPLGPSVRASEFEVLGELAARLPLRRVNYAHDFSTLPALCSRILGDFETLGDDDPCTSNA